MAAINTGKVVAGGLVAGVVLNVVDFVANYFIIGERFKANWDAINPALWPKMTAPSTMVTFVITDFLVGIILVWTYAAMRPRFGPGPRTALVASLLLWFFGTILYSGMMASGLFTMAAFVTYGCIALVNFLIAGWVGARLYSEPA
jgi:hypothetical protein